MVLNPETSLDIIQGGAGGAVSAKRSGIPTDVVIEPSTSKTPASLAGLRRMRSHTKQDQLRRIVSDMDLLISVDKAANLPKADWFGTIDPYLTIAIVEGDPRSPGWKGPTEHRGWKSPLGNAKSSVIRQNQFPTWEEKLRIPLPAGLAKTKDDEGGLDYRNLYLRSPVLEEKSSSNTFF